MAEKKTSRKLSTANTKQEMLESYNTLLLEMEELREAEQKPEEKIAVREIQQKIVTADKLTAESIIKDISDLKFKFGQALSDLSEKLEEEANKYHSIKKAVEAKNQELQEVFEIRKAASSLAALLEAQNIRKAEFDADWIAEKEKYQAEMASQREEWEKEKTAHLNEAKDRDAQEKKARDRAKEEFEYNFRIEQKQARDSFETEKAALERQLAKMKEDAEKTLSEREKAIGEREEELAALRKKAAGYEKELETAVTKAIKDATEKIITENKYRESLIAKEFEGERNVMAARIQSLESKIAEQNETILNLNRQIEKSYGQVQDIAVKAVEGAKNKYQPVIVDNSKKE